MPIVKRFDPGLKLLAIGGEKFGLDSVTQNYIDQEIRVKVPPGTKFVHVSILSQDVGFGTLPDGRIPREIASLTTEITVAHTGTDLDIDSNGMCTINFRAALQDKAQIATSGSWGGQFNLEIMCFGN